MSEVRARELGMYLRTLRDRTTPESVGLPTSARRRVPGLRREEVAVLANVGTTWYTWLEQGRDVRPSAGVLDAIAAALDLEPAERAHLLMLGGHPHEARGPECAAAGPRLQALLDSMAPNPAAAVGPLFNVTGYNPPFRYLYGDLEALPEADRNTAYLHLVHPTWSAAYGPDDRAAMVAKLREAYADTLDDPRWAPFLERLERESPEFRELWAQGNVVHDAQRVKRVESPWAGQLRLQAVTMALVENPRTRVIAQLPADSVTVQRLARLSELIATGRVDEQGATLRLVPESS